MNEPATIGVAFAKRVKNEGKIFMKLHKLFSMTAAFFIGAVTTALMADDDRAHRGDRDRNHGEHARGDHDKRKVASSRLAELKKSAEAPRMPPGDSPEEQKHTLTRVHSFVLPC